MSARTSFFILMVASSVSTVLSFSLSRSPFPSLSLFLSRTSLPPPFRRLPLVYPTPLSRSRSHFSVYLFLSSLSLRRFYRGPFIHGLILVSPSSATLFLFSPPQLLLLTPAGSTASFYLGANVLIACGRSLRPSRFPPPSTFFVFLVTTSRPPTVVEIVTTKTRVSRTRVWDLTLERVSHATTKNITSERETHTIT